VHVAGTKGKGSTSALIASVLHAAGYETGLFSSPHLERLEERFAVNGAACSEQELVALVERLRPVVQAMDRAADQASDATLRPTYFELTTAMALMHFAQRKVDVAMLEVGLGGRLDSTNVCQPTVCVITSISRDHTRQLGDRLEQIAAEKAGIIKPGVPVLCGPIDDGPRQVVAQIARQHGCRLLEAGHSFRHRYRPPRELDVADHPGRLDFEFCDGESSLKLPGVPLRLVGEHQADNGALALATVAELRRQGWLISTQAMHQGLESLALPGRVEVISRRPTVVLDVAHNVASAQALVEVLQESFACRERLLVLSVSHDKDVQGILQTLLPHFGPVIVTQYQENPRAVPVAKLAEMVRQLQRQLGRGEQAERVSERAVPIEAWQLAREMARDDQLICVTGSFFIAAELRSALQLGD